MTGAVGHRPLNRRGLLTGAAAVVLLAAGSTLAVAAGTGGLDSTSSGTRSAPNCTAPALSGTTVSVRIVDMRSMMSRGGMMGGPGGLLGQGDWRHFSHGMMRVLVSASSVPAGTVSLRATNAGYLTHELVVLPLAVGQLPGARSIGNDGKVDETGSLGEASATCAAGAGEGIAAGSTGWVSLHLPAGRYELVCNLPGHYAAGMHAELDVT